MVSGPTPPWYRRVGRGALRNVAWVDVSYEGAAGLLESRQPLGGVGEETLHRGRIFQAVDSDVQHDRPVADVLAGQHGWPACRSHQNCCLAADRWEVGSPRVANGDRGVLGQKQHRGRLAHDVAATDDDRVAALDLNLAPFKDFDEAARRAGRETRLPRWPACPR